MTSALVNPLHRNQFIVKERLGLFKAANNFDLFDPSSGELVAECREEKLGFFTKVLRFTDFKRSTPFHIEIREPGGETLIQVKRGVAVFRSRVLVLDGRGVELGAFQQRLLSVGGKFDLLSPNGEPLCTLSGKWTGWDFSFVREGLEFARIQKKWAGLGKEFFTSADNYMLSIDPQLDPDHPLRGLIVAAVMCIDMVLKE